MWTVFSKWGRVGVVIIPQKCDKRGNRFGFVRFKQTDEDDKLLKVLEQVWIGNYKIKINNLRFKRKEDRNFKGVTSTRSILQPVDFHSKVINKEERVSSRSKLLIWEENYFFSNQWGRKKWIKSSKMKNTSGNLFLNKSTNGAPQPALWNDWCGFSALGFRNMLGQRIY
ncbi:hypothetical protein Lal_00012572 [Lupinus albus]|nr:hypothetical protein Lal_00012572 [Lupinus albus]